MIPHTRKDDWEPNVQAVLELMDGNLKSFVRELQRADYYPKTEPPQLPRPDSPVPSGYAFKLTNPNASGNDPLHNRTGVIPAIHKLSSLMKAIPL